MTQIFCGCSPWSLSPGWQVWIPAGNGWPLPHCQRCRKTAAYTTLSQLYSLDKPKFSLKGCLWKQQNNKETGTQTNIQLFSSKLTMDRCRLPLVTKVSPLAQSMPNSAQMSPAITSFTSWAEKCTDVKQFVPWLWCKALSWHKKCFVVLKNTNSNKILMHTYNRHVHTHTHIHMCTHTHTMFCCPEKYKLQAWAHIHMCTH